MATTALPSAEVGTIAWLQRFLRGEMAPYPGRTALAARMVLSATIVMIIVMIFRIPYGAFAGLFTLTLSRENPDATLREVKTLTIWFAVSTAYVLVGALLFFGDPVLHLVWVLVSLFLMFYALSAAANYTAAMRFVYLLSISIPLWDSHISSERKVTGLLWAAGAIALASAITAVVEILYAGIYRISDLTELILDQLGWTEAALRGWAAGVADRRAEQQLARLAILGTSRIRREMLRSGYSPEITQQWGAIVSLVGRLVDLAANLSHFSPPESAAARGSVGELAEQIHVLARRLESGSVSQDFEKGAGSVVLEFGIPLLMDIERTVQNMVEVLDGSDLPSTLRLPAKQRQRRIFVSDAFTNSDHIRFAIRGSLAAAACYLFYNLVNWPEISTAVTTCILTALSTVGSSRQRQILRFGGALAGGVAGMCAQVFVLPGVDSIAGLTVLFIAATAIAAWIITSGPRLSYFGIQFAFAFYLINFEEFWFQTSLDVAVDRVLGILVGLCAMWLIFDQLWGAPAILEMERSFLSTLRLLAQFIREPQYSAAFDREASIAESYEHRETLNTNFNNLRASGDGVMLEFGSSRESNLKVRSQLLVWQIQLRVIFITRIALLKYRLRLAGFELPESVLLAQGAFDVALARRMEEVADLLQGKESQQQVRAPLLDVVESSIREYRAGESDPVMALRLDSLLHLCARIDSLVISLVSEIAAAS